MGLTKLQIIFLQWMFLCYVGYETIGDVYNGLVERPAIGFVLMILITAQIYSMKDK